MNRQEGYPFGLIGVHQHINSELPHKRLMECRLNATVWIRPLTLKYIITLGINKQMTLRRVCLSKVLRSSVPALTLNASKLGNV